MEVNYFYFGVALELLLFLADDASATTSTAAATWISVVYGRPQFSIGNVKNGVPQWQTPGLVGNKRQF